MIGKFEEALQKAFTTYVSQDEVLPLEAIDEIFNEHLYVVEMWGKKECPSVVIPGPNLWKLSTGQDETHLFTHVKEDDKNYNSKVDARIARWPHLQNGDSIIQLEFKFGTVFNKKDCNYVEFHFYNALPIPNNKCGNTRKYIPTSYNQNRKLTETVWVESRGYPIETYYNESKFGCIRTIWTEGFSRFARAPKKGEDEDNIDELMISIAGDERGIWKVTPRVVTRLPEEQERTYNGAALGEGSLTALLKHMEYETLIDKVVR